jgi:hypothetical protein
MPAAPAWRPRGTDCVAARSVTGDAILSRRILAPTVQRLPRDANICNSGRPRNWVAEAYGGNVRLLAAVLTLPIFAACSGVSTGPSSIGTIPDISGHWLGTFASSNNTSYEIAVDLTQSGSGITGAWDGDLVAWDGEVTGTVSSTSFSGALSFRGTSEDGTVCTGEATITGSASASSISVSSPTGVVGGSCPASLPIGIQIDLHR